MLSIMHFQSQVNCFQQLWAAWHRTAEILRVVLMAYLYFTIVTSVLHRTCIMTVAPHQHLGTCQLHCPAYPC